MGIAVNTGLPTAGGAIPNPDKPSGSVAGVVDTVENLSLGSVQPEEPALIPPRSSMF
ncbi:hypothetical protein DSECCO2_257000 [anaerobic digester metagenome]